MTYSGDAAEQIMRIGIQGAEMALRISGTGAKHLSVLIYSILKDRQKTAGKTRLVNMLKSGRELNVFTVAESDINAFSKEAKRYGVLYCALREKKKDKTGMVDIMTGREDASKISRIIEKLNLATVDVAGVSPGTGNNRNVDPQESPERNLMDSGKEESLVDALLEKPAPKETDAPENPTAAKTERSPRSENTSKDKGTSERGTSDSSRKSCREEMDEIRKQRNSDLASGNTQKRTENALKNRAPSRSMATDEGRNR